MKDELAREMLNNRQQLQYRDEQRNKEVHAVRIENENLIKNMHADHDYKMQVFVKDHGQKV